MCDGATAVRLTLMPAMREKVKAAVAVVLLLALGGCGGAGEWIPETQLRSLVLQPSDVGPGYVQFDFGPQAFTDYRPGPREDPGRFGRLNGWKARYRKANPRATAGPLVIESLADVFRDQEGAEKDLSAYEEQFQASIRDSRGRAEELSAPRIGDDTVAMTLAQASGTMAVRFFRIAWRDRNVTAFLEVSGFERTLALRYVVQLARRQHRMIAGAASA